MLKKVGEGIWCARQDLKLFGCNIGTRMTVVRLANGELWLYSPVELTDELRAQLDALGPVTHLVSPNTFHHIYLKRYAEAYPHAKVYAMPQLAKKRPDLANIQSLSELKNDAFGPELQWLIFQGRAGYRELLVFHPQSATLLLCDLAFNLQVTTTPWEHFILSLYGVKGKFGPTLLERFLTKGAPGREVWPRILAWDFQRIIPCHGEILDRNARAVFRHAFEYME